MRWIDGESGSYVGLADGNAATGTINGEQRPGSYISILQKGRQWARGVIASPLTCMILGDSATLMEVRSDMVVSNRQT